MAEEVRGLSGGAAGIAEGGAGVEEVHVSDSTRRALFYVRSFTLSGCELSSTSPQEVSRIESLGTSALNPPFLPAQLAVVSEEMIGAPIDPEVLRDAPSVSAALAAIAVNASNVCCARLNHVWKTDGNTDALRCAILPVR